MQRIERAVVHYGKSTGFFSDKMVQRGPAYLSAAVLYENLVVESYQKSPALPLVAVYPTEGTFWADHPYAILDAPWVDAEGREAAQSFLAFLKARPVQERALALGFRPGDPAIAIRTPVDAAHGADPQQPQTLLEVPDAPVLESLLELWRKSKRPANVVLVMDKSGSMRGEPLEQAKAGAVRFLDSLQGEDSVTLVLFDNQVYPAVGPLRLSSGKAELAQRIRSVFANGGTSLYDATLAAHALAQTQADADPARIHAVLVMTDGRDENSTKTLKAVREQLSSEEHPKSVPVFTIAYGDQADGSILEQIAESAQGSSARGTSQTIVQVYQDMASFF